MFYWIPDYEELGLKVPTTWAEFMANNAKLKAVGKTPVIQSYGDTWTSQIFVLADFFNVSAHDPDWAKNYTNNQAKYATDPVAPKASSTFRTCTTPATSTRTSGRRSSMMP